MHQIELGRLNLGYSMKAKITGSELLGDGQAILEDIIQLLI